mmetsp:Transcript_146290/g.207450  ORF Transcript_146290/g.207450 Transcript_146290/m.207450 type:complete len:244 (+) Transcript_146290:205-936(+)
MGFLQEVNFTRCRSSLHKKPMQLPHALARSLVDPGLLRCHCSNGTQMRWSGMAMAVVLLVLVQLHLPQVQEGVCHLWKCGRSHLVGLGLLDDQGNALGQVSQSLAPTFYALLVRLKVFDLTCSVAIADPAERLVGASVAKQLVLQLLRRHVRHTGGRRVQLPDQPVRVAGQDAGNRISEDGHAGEVAHTAAGKVRCQGGPTKVASIDCSSVANGVVLLAVYVVAHDVGLQTKIVGRLVKLMPQ